MKKLLATLGAILMAAGVMRSAETERPAYLLGVDDRIAVWAVGFDELQGKEMSIDQTGHVSLPLIGRVQVAGLTVEQFASELTRRYRVYIREPQISVSLLESRSQPVSVVGAVNTPGQYQLQGGHTLLEMITKAGGLKPSAGSFVKIMRPVASGAIPIEGAALETTGQFNWAEVNIRALLASDSSKENIVLKPHDIVTVPDAQMIYVVGEVSKPGAFPYGEGQQLTILQAVALAGGLTRAAHPNGARILRPIMGGPKRAELPADLKNMLNGRSHDLPLMANDILFVPDSTGKKITSRVIETMIQTGTYALTWGVIAH